MAKTTKHGALLFIKSRFEVKSDDLMCKFNITDSGARSYLLFLMKQNLIQRDSSRRYSLTAYGKRRLEWFDDNGCTSKYCEKCRLLKPYMVKCLQCKKEFNKNELHITPESDLPFIFQEGTVFCPNCRTPICSYEMAEKIGIEWGE